MGSTTPLLLVLFSFCNLLYMHFMQYNNYDGFISEASIISLFLCYIVWFLMSIALKKFVIEDKEFGFKSAFIRAPFIGFLIYMAINVSIMAVVPDWPLELAFTDVVFGTSLFSFVTLIVVVFEKFFD